MTATHYLINDTLSFVKIAKQRQQATNGGRAKRSIDQDSALSFAWQTGRLSEARFGGAHPNVLEQALKLGR